jgi:asparagine synthase (glutamine-hydrolysing)
MADVLGRINGFSRFEKYAPLLKTPLCDYYYSRVRTPFSYFNFNRKDICTDDFLASANEAGCIQFVHDLFGRVADKSVLNQMLYVDTKTWLPDDLLVKADKMTMANSLELRVPLLDHLVLELAAGLPDQFKVKGLATKRVLKEAFRDKIPIEIIKRRKTGLPVPLRKWMRDDLKDYIREVLLSEKSLHRGYFCKSAVEDLINRNAVEGSLMKELFSLLTLELWHSEFIDSPRS